MPNTPPHKKHSPTKQPPTIEILLAGFGAFAGIAVVAWVEQLWIADADLPYLIGSFGASAVLLYAARFSPLAQPYNLLVGHGVSALAGVAVFHAVGEVSWLSVALSVSLAIVAMQLTRSVHPPGGATALIAVVGSDAIHQLGYWYVLFPVLSGAVLMLAVALLTNNLVAGANRDKPFGKRWPLYWWPWT